MTLYVVACLNKIPRFIPQGPVRDHSHMMSTLRERVAPIADIGKMCEIYTVLQNEM